MPKMKVTITLEYLAQPGFYDTDVPEEMAAIAQADFDQDPSALMGMLEDEEYTVTVEPIAGED